MNGMETWQTLLVSAFTGLIMLLGNAWVNRAKNRQDAKLKAEEKAQDWARLDAVADKAQKVADVLEESTKKTDTKLVVIDEKADKIHNLVDGAMTMQLEVNAGLAEFKAATTKLPADIEAATKARQKYEDHLKTKPTDSDIQKSQDKIIETLQKVVETKADQTQEVVKDIPDEVVKKLPPK